MNLRLCHGAQLYWKRGIGNVSKDPVGVGIFHVGKRGGIRGKMLAAPRTRLVVNNTIAECFAVANSAFALATKPP